MVSVANAVTIGIGQPTISNGVITGISVVSGGSDFTTAPTVSITDDGGGSGAAATATISGGVVTSVAVNSGGSGYSANTKVYFLPSIDDIGTTPDDPNETVPDSEPDTSTQPDTTPEEPSTGTAKFINMSTRGRVDSTDGNDHLILGFIWSGNEQGSLFMRGRGPSMSAFFSGTMTDPVLNGYQTSSNPPGQAFTPVVLESNDDWQSATGLNEVRSEQTAAFDASNTESLVVMHNLEPSVGYSGNIGGEKGTGIAIVEIFDLAHDNGQTSDARIVNGSSRGVAGELADERILGFIIDGEDGSTLDIRVRATGPSLAQFGLNGIPNPEVRLYNTGVNPPVELFYNDDWETVTADANAEQISSELAPILGLTDSNESGFIYRNLAPGAYSVNVSPKDGTAEGVTVVSVDIIE